MGDKVQVKLIGIDDSGKLKLSRRVLLPQTSSDETKPEHPRREKPYKKSEK